MGNRAPGAAPILRSADLRYVLNAVRDSRSCSVIGVSNVGKSWLLRALSRKDLRAGLLEDPVQNSIFVYVDCNLMLQLTEQGFYEAVLRATRDVLVQNGVDRDLLDSIEAFYQGVVDSSQRFRVPLSFNEAIITLAERLQKRLVFLFDEFDEPFGALDGRVFLNLRALKDRFGLGLCYITATEQPLSKPRSETTVAEFTELFAGRMRWLGMLEPEDAKQLVLAQAAAEGAELEHDQVEFVLDQAGGHPGLLQATTQVLMRVEVGAPQNMRQQGLVLARDVLDSDPIIHSECAKLWDRLEAEEKEALTHIVTLGSDDLEDPLLRSLQRKGILAFNRSGRDGPRDEPYRIFAKVFQRFTRRQRLIREGAVQGVVVDVDAGEAWVDGVQVPTLTDLEYRLLLLLYGRLGKICDKYQIVEVVWGESYIDQVDDARIEKLVSRLRAKLEKDPSNPNYLITVRGRGYKLIRP